MTSPQNVLVIDLDDKPENQRLLAGAPQTHGLRSGRVYLSPGQSCGLHSTKDREELLVFLGGEGEIIIGQDNRFQVGKGKVCYIPPRTDHDVKNTGSKPLVYVYGVAPVTD